MTATATAFPIHPHRVELIPHPFDRRRTPNRVLHTDAGEDAARVYSGHVRSASLHNIATALGALIPRAIARVPGITVLAYATADGDAAYCTVHQAVDCPFSGDPAEVSRCIITATPVHRLDVVALGLPVFDGAWIPLGTLSVDTVGVITSTTFPRADDTSPAATDHRELAGQCAHCKTNRRRTITVLLRHRDTGEIRPVGKACLAEYTDGRIRSELLAALTKLGERIGLGIGGTYSQPDDTAPTLIVVAAARKLVTDHGFVRSGFGDRTTDDTRTRLRRVICPQDGETPDFHVDQLTAADKAAAAADIALIAGMDDGSDYITNLRAIVFEEWCQVLGRGSKLGLLASLPSAVDRAREGETRRKAEEIEAAASDWVGAQGEKLTLTGVVASCGWTEPGVYGARYRISMLIGANAVKMFTTAAGLVDVEAGQIITISGTVKSHDEFRGRRETMIVRPKLVELVSTP